MTADFKFAAALAAVAAVVLAGGWSAAGADNHPYEVYHCGARSVACLLGQALYVTARQDRCLQRALGDRAG